MLKVTQTEAKWDYQTYARIFASSPEKAKEYRDSILNKKEQDIDDKIEEIRNIVADPAKVMEEVYTKWEEELETIKSEADDQEKKAELRKLLKDKWIKITNFMSLSKLMEVAKENKIIE